MGMQVSFYHLTRVNLQKSLPKLLEKIIQKGERVVVMVQTEAEVTSWNETLWTYHPQSFLPHGTAKEGCATEQPIWIACGMENPNGASVMVRPGVEAAPGVELLSAQGFQKMIHVFEADVEEGLAQAKNLWGRYGGHTTDCVYWQQGEGGEWLNETASIK